MKQNYGKKPREQRRAEGEERNSKWQAQSPEQQLAYLDKNGFRAEKQRAQIQKKLETK